MVATLTSLTDQILDRLATEETVRIEASLDEYWDTLADLADEPILLQYINHHICAEMSQATDSHETIVANMIRFLGQAFYDQPDIRVMGSNKVVYVPDCMLATNPDVLVMKGESQLLPRKRRAAGIVNPYILVEVRSDSTALVDEMEKLPCYKKLESVQHIIYIDPRRAYVTVYTKNQDVRHWFNDDYDDLSQSILLGDVSLPMSEVYHKVLLVNSFPAGLPELQAE
jgi:Uma2 family endonuclease